MSFVGMLYIYIPHFAVQSLVYSYTISLIVSPFKVISSDVSYEYQKK